LSRPVNPPGADEPLGIPRPAALLLFPTGHRCAESKSKARIAWAPRGYMDLWPRKHRGACRRGRGIPTRTCALCGAKRPTPSDGVSLPNDPASIGRTEIPQRSGLLPVSCVLKAISAW